MAFRINESYAKKYNEWKQKEEKQKLKAKYGDDDLDDDDDDSSSSEDDDAEVLTAKMEKGWLKALAALKSHDPSIYDPQKKFYESSDESSSSGDEDGAGSQRKKSKKEKAMFLKDYEREVIVEKDGKYEDEDEDDDEDEVDSRATLKMEPGYYEEQEEIKKGFKDLLHDSDSEGEDLLLEKKKSTEEKEAEEVDYLQWLKGKEASNIDEESKAEIKPLKEYWSDPKISASDAYLRDFILNKRYVEKDDDDDDDVAGFHGNEDEDLDEEEEILQKQETFEHKYNFRYEEPDAEFIKSYPRTIGDSLRQKDTRRKEKRKAQKERKALEKAKKKEEIKQFKNIKKKEILAKLEQLKEVTGNKELGFKEADMDEAFEPSKHDEMMKQAFSEDYYEDMGDDEDDDEKPVFSDMDDDEYGEEQYGEDGGEEWNGEAHCEDPDFNMDADYDPNAQPSTSYSTKKDKKRFKDAVSKKKPVFDPSEKTFEEYLDEYYKLDFEDVIGDLPCRFKYREVVPNDFGLSTEEILTAKPGELNKWVSVKKMSMYRTEEEELYDRRKFQSMAQKGVKYKVMPSLTEEEQKEAVEASGAATSKKGKKKKKGGAATTPATQPSPTTAPPANSNKKQKQKQQDKQEGKKEDTDSNRTQPSDIPTKKRKAQDMSTDSPSKKRKDKKKWVKSKQDKSYSIPEDRFKAYGMDPKNYKGKHANK